MAALAEARSVVRTITPGTLLTQAARWRSVRLQLLSAVQGARERIPPVAWLILLFVATRLFFLTLVHPDRLVDITGDELYVGTIAQELLTGLKLPFPEYRANTYAGGSLIIGATAAGFFRLLGPTIFALKLAPLLWFTLTLLVWYELLARYANERVAMYWAWLFILPPPIFTVYSLQALGSHTESILLTGVSLFLLLRLLSDDRSPVSSAALLGLIAGVSLWFCYIYSLTLAAVLIVWWSRGSVGRASSRLMAFGLSFVIGFLPWILINARDPWAAFVIDGFSLWDRWGFEHLQRGLVDYRVLGPYQFLATFASDDPESWPRWALNLIYASLILGPLLAALLVRKTPWSGSTGATSRQPLILRFGMLYLALFFCAVTLTNFRYPRYHMVTYPFLFTLLAFSLVRLEEIFPLIRRRLRGVFLCFLVVLGVGAYAQLCSLEGAGSAFSAKGYSYAALPKVYLCREALWPCADRIVPRLERSPLLVSMLPRLAPEDQRDFSLELVPFLAAAASGTHDTAEFSRIEQLAPSHYKSWFSYWLGIQLMISRDRNDLGQAIAEAGFLRSRSPEAYHLAIAGIYRLWVQRADAEMPPESLIRARGGVDPEVSPSFWRALGYYAAGYWSESDRSLDYLDGQLQTFIPRLDPFVRRYALQGIGQFLFSRWTIWPVFALSFAPSQLERFPPTYQQGLFEGAGMELGESQLAPWFSWNSDIGPAPHQLLIGSVWQASTRGLSETSISYIREGRKQFTTIFEGPSPKALAQTDLEMTESIDFISTPSKL